MSEGLFAERDAFVERGVLEAGADADYLGSASVFVDRALAERLNLPEVPLENANSPFSLRQFWAFDGTLISTNGTGKFDAPEIMRIPWHTFLFAQPIPKSLRFWKVGGQYFLLENCVSLLTLAVVRPNMLPVFGSRSFAIAR